jgi:hypothetical protein
MIIVTTADPLYGPELAGAGGWKYEGAINEVVAGFIKSLPKKWRSGRFGSRCPSACR